MRVLPDIKMTLRELGITRVEEFEDAKLAVEYAIELEKGGHKKITRAVRALEAGREIKERPPYCAYYPYIGVYVGDRPVVIDPNVVHGYARVENELLGCTVAGLDFLSEYYTEELSRLVANHQTTIFVGLSTVEMPLSFVVREHTLDAKQVKLFSRVEAEQINLIEEPSEDNPLLSYFSGPRIDYSRTQFEHHTGTSLADCQRYVVLVNYQMFEQIFLELAQQQLKEDSEQKLVMPEALTKAGDKKGISRPQMPAIHLTRPDRSGITLINIGVGPSNAKTIVDNIAVIRPHLVLMVGHCAGLRHTHYRGRVIIGEAFIRHDGLMDHRFESGQPILAQGAVIKTLKEAVAAENGNGDYHPYGESGVVLSTADRHWEIDKVLRDRIRNSRALALDMESATVAAASFLFRIPFGALLIVTDMPTFGEVKLQGKAQEVYLQSVERHMRIVFRAIHELRAAGRTSTQSRNLRGALDSPLL